MVLFHIMKESTKSPDLRGNVGYVGAWVAWIKIFFAWDFAWVKIFYVGPKFLCVFVFVLLFFVFFCVDQLLFTR